MSLTVKSLNGDTAFLLTFESAGAPPSSPGLFPGPQRFDILVDPWLIGPSIILNSSFSISHQKAQPCIAHLKQLEREPDLVLISQDKPDHCHKETLLQLPPDCESTILAIPSAARKIRSWKHFRPSTVHSLSKYTPGVEQSIYRVILPPTTPRGSCGEVTVTWMPAKRDVSKLHHAIGITYRSPSAPLSAASSDYYFDLPMSPPASPGSPKTIASSPRTIVPSPYHDREKTLSVIYSPHGVGFDVIRPYAASHLVSESALPLTALLHSFDCVDNPWYLGGNISAGSRGGLQIARSLYAEAWISAHDADKDNRGWSVRQTRIAKSAIDQIKRMLEDGHENKRIGSRTDVVSLAAGENRRLAR